MKILMSGRHSISYSQTREATTGIEGIEIEHVVLLPSLRKVTGQAISSFIKVVKLY